MEKKLVKLLLISILVLAIIVKIPSLFDPVYYGDECIYLTLGQAFNKGLVFYKDIHDNKPPLIYLLAALANGKLYWFRLIAIAWNTINIYLVFLISDKIFKNLKAGLIAALIFFILSFIPEGRIANGEIFMIMPVTLGIFFILNSQHWLLAGLCFSLGFLFKVPVLFDFLACFLGFFIFKENKLANIFKKFDYKKICLFCLGFTVPIIVSIVYYYFQGAQTPYLRSALMQNMGYLSSWKNQEGGNFLIRNQGLIARGMILLVLTIGLFIMRRSLKFYFTFFCLWFSFSLFGALLSERPYPHYLIQLAPSLSFMLTSILVEFKLVKVLVLPIFLSLLSISFLGYKFWWYPIIPYYKNFIGFISGKISKNEYLSFFGNSIINYNVSEFIISTTETGDRIFVWGEEAPCIYALSRRLPPGRFTANYHISDFNGFDETSKAIMSHKPNLIIKFNKADNFDQLNKILDKYYFWIKNINQVQIYKEKIFYED